MRRYLILKKFSDKWFEEYSNVINISLCNFMLKMLNVSYFLELKFLTRKNKRQTCPLLCKDLWCSLLLSQTCCSFCEILAVNLFSSWPSVKHNLISLACVLFLATSNLILKEIPPLQWAVIFSLNMVPSLWFADHGAVSF